MPYLMECETIEKYAELANELMLQFVEINIGYPDCMLNSSLAKRLIHLRDKYGIYFTMHMDEQADPFAFNDEIRTAWLRVFTRAIKVAQQADSW